MRLKDLTEDGLGQVGLSSLMTTAGAIAPQASQTNNSNILRIKQQQRKQIQDQINILNKQIAVLRSQLAAIQ